GPDVLSEKLSDFYTWDPPEDDVIEDIKTKNPKLPLAKLTVGMWTFIIKSLTRQDVQNIDREEPEDVSIAKVVTIWPTNVDWDMLPYGIFRFITAEANNLGGWDDDIEIEEL
ncbi:MAG: hypothetical protein KGI25_10045, partial [Thaumarchaeota archaeon]|nr:hypothetical protein [Nitrososphaerota archaeon]